MAGLSACRSSCRNPCPADEDEFAGVAPTESSSIPTLHPVVLCALTPAPATAFAVAPSSDNKLFKQFIKAYLEAQVPTQIAPEIEPKSCKQSLKARFPDFYYGNLHMNFYRFCQQYKDYFKTVGAKRPNKILFTAFFCVSWSPNNGSNTNDVATELYQ